MQHLPSTPPPPLPATERAIHEAGLAFAAGHRVPLVARPDDMRRHVTGSTPRACGPTWPASGGPG
ncbi:MAG: hypothetical protein NTY94_18230 [Alphaproteobacteria bacterium]|nr:hypothetical protein [Alphaproteobacteria bacterium]